MYEQNMEAVQTRRCEECIPDRSSEPSGTRPHEGLRTMIETSNLLANENRAMAERLHEFLFGLGNRNEAENRKEPGCFWDSLQAQIDVSTATNKKLNEILSRLGA